MGFGGAAEGGVVGEAYLGGDRYESERRVPQQRLNALHAPAVEQHVRALAVGALKEAAKVGGGQSPFASSLRLNYEAG
jgi:hypothetical protein